MAGSIFLLDCLGEAKTYCMQVAQAMRDYHQPMLPWSEAPRGLQCRDRQASEDCADALALPRSAARLTFIATS
jgi:hypothetical protein